jgi:hypothetical protein
MPYEEVKEKSGFSRSEKAHLPGGDKKRVYSA